MDTDILRRLHYAAAIACGVFAALVILGALGIALHSSVRRLEHRVVHWAHRGKS